jgi:hypothetical protein
VEEMMFALRLSLSGYEIVLSFIAGVAITIFMLWFLFGGDE